MIEFLQTHGYAIWLGFSLAMSGVSVVEKPLHFFLVLLPTVGLVMWKSTSGA